ncbi:CLP1 [Hepatospora eriocheir]|uniref:Polynucleotide 5'-hydroxyl-kinase GRC3 n=1 Tax=Hepatospora eriocheir TaxID=1081669 RepID=A0A1X0QJS7_9MICR|nr:CLP1 [Hepatospora eriocheir]
MTVKVFELAQNQEFCFEVNENQTIEIRVECGLGEIKGRELIIDKWYVFTDIKTSIFTFTGCKLSVDDRDDPVLCYISHSSVFPHIFNFFHEIKDLDENNLNILVLGTGRSTFTATLSNYFLRLHRNVLLTEIDLSKGNIFPGTVSTMIVENLIEDYFSINNPYCLFYGSTEIKNKELYETQMKLVRDRVIEQRKEFLLPNFIIGMFWESSMLQKTIDIFKVNKIVVIGNERLFHKLDVKIPKYFIENSNYIYENTIGKSIKRYFNGTPSMVFKPCRIMLNRNIISIIKLNEDFMAPESALPLGTARKSGVSGLVEVENMSENIVMSISETDNKDKVFTTPSMGFVVCIDEKKGRILACQPKIPKCNYLVYGDFKYIDL